MFDQSRVAWVLGDADLQYLAQRLADEPEPVTFDLETSGLDEWAPDAAVVLLSVTVGSIPSALDTYIVPLSHPQSPWLGHWRAVLRTVCCAFGPVTNHNIKFDCRWVSATTGVDLSRQVVWDTQVSSHLLDENSSTKLKERAPAIFGIEPWNQGIDFDAPGAALNVPLVDLGIYAAQDTYWTHRLALAHRQLLAQPALGPGEWPDPEQLELLRLGQVAREISVPTVRTLTQVEQRGMLLDGDWARTKLADNGADLTVLGDKLRDRYPGLDPEEFSMAATSHWFRAWTEAAVATGDLEVAAMTGTGQPSWSKGVLVRQARDGSEVAGMVLAYRKLAKQDEFLRAWLAHQAADGAVHARYNVGSVITGRLSSSEPNMQQVTAALRPAWVARPGFLLAELDYSQIELRVAAFVAGCEPMLAAFHEGRDLHLHMAGVINRDASICAARLQLMRWGLPPDGTGAEVLRALSYQPGAGAAAVEGLQRSSGDWSDQAARGWQRWRAERGGELPVEGGDLAGPVSAIPEGLLRALRGYYQRWGWPWEWDAADPGRAPHRPQPQPQRALEPDDALSVVSSSSASRLEALTGDPWAEWRQRAKAADFGLVYGLDPFGFQQYAETQYGVAMSTDEAVEVHRAFFELWDGMAEWHTRAAYRCRNSGQVTSPLGRVRRLPGIWDADPKTRAFAERCAVNAPVQGMASDLMQIAAAWIMGNLSGRYPAVPGVHIVGTVHDSIVVEVPADAPDDAVARCVDRMTRVPEYLADRLGCTFDVPLAVGVTVGDRWRK